MRGEKGFIKALSELNSIQVTPDQNRDDAEGRLIGTTLMGYTRLPSMIPTK